MKSNFNQIAAAMSTMLARGRPATVAPGHPGGGAGRVQADWGQYIRRPRPEPGRSASADTSPASGFRSTSARRLNRKPLPRTLGAAHLCPAPKKNSGSSTPKNDPPALPTGKNLLAGEGRFGRLLTLQPWWQAICAHSKSKANGPCQGTCSSSIPAAYCLPESEI